MGNQKYRIPIIVGTVSVMILDVLLPFSTDVYAETGESEAIYRSKGTITDEADINIDSSDIYILDNAINANNKTLENYSATAGDIYNNLSAIDSAVAKAKTNIAQSLEDMNIYVSRTDAGAVNSHAGTTDWVGTTTSAKNAAVTNYTLEELIGQMKTSVTGAESEMTAKINAGDFKSKKATSSVSSGSQSINLAGATEINLDKNQQLVLPSGYYGNGMTINNVISGETLDWNPAGKATLVIDKPYTSGTISTFNAYDSGVKEGRDAGYKDGHAVGYKEGQTEGYNNGKNAGRNETLNSINPCVINRDIILTDRKSFSFAANSGSYYIVDMMLAGYFNAHEISIYGGYRHADDFQENISIMRDRWTTNLVLLIRANSSTVTIYIGGEGIPGKGEYNRQSVACVYKCF
ncbi:hypothetical protein [Butyrivibrio sp. AE2005]|uniref:hypothetical protein n=1 Tax=Butyrivibrio sp. AE2005 TaxID=1496722 RepID=UPI0004793967|nr:hypothetical protein [Butyrivibrio sp. AE2005]